MSPGLVNIAYLVAASLFIFGLKGLSHPRTAVRGNRLGALGMLLAIVITLLDQSIVGYGIILAGIVVGGGIGAVLAVRIKMTDMPQLVALFNGFGGVASVLVAGAALLEVAVLKGTLGSIAINAQFSISTFASGLIGAITFWGSLVAFGKLQGLTNDGSVRYPGDQIVKVVLVIAILIFGYMMVIYPDSSIPYWLMVIVASVLGILFVIPI
ncbi:MAG: NAD(P)(+) transhydrogenase (Re/Si-specific) subunit beta, partial [Thermodesulfobacteriota bacterium]